MNKQRVLTVNKKINILFLLLGIVTIRSHAMEEREYPIAPMAYYGLAIGSYRQSEEKRACYVPEEIISCINEVEIPLDKKLIDGLQTLFCTYCEQHGMSKAGPPTDLLPFITFSMEVRKQNYSKEQQYSKWSQFIAKSNFVPKAMKQEEIAIMATYWKQEIDRRSFYWVKKQDIARYLMKHIWVGLENDKSTIGIMLEDQFSPPLEDSDGLLTQFVLGLQEGIVEQLWGNMRLQIKDAKVIQAPSTSNNLLVKNLFNICGIAYDSTCFMGK